MVGLLDRLADAGALSSGAIIADLLAKHRDYLEPHVIVDDLASVGPVRTVADHVDLAAQQWDPRMVSMLSGRYVLLALALEPAVGRLLLRSGVVASLLAMWRPGSGTADEPHRLVWDVLGDEGRARADDQPLLAAAFGAPAEWVVDLPAPASALAWSPGCDRVAAVAGGAVYEASPDEHARRINDVGEHVISLGWGDEGVLALSVERGAVEITRVPTRAVVVRESGARGGRLSGDGSRAWLEGPDGVTRWSQRQPKSPQLAPVAGVLALDSDGRQGLLAVGSESVFVVDARAASRPGASQPDWPPDGASVVATGPALIGHCALVAWDSAAGVATTDEGKGIVVRYIGGMAGDGLSRNADDSGFRPVARLATGADPITALATDSTGTRLAVALGSRVAVWTLAQQRPKARMVPGYDSDRAAGEDLLGVDLDARALAALIASRDLRPPLAIGLFGPWGSGKSFVLRRIENMIGDRTGPDAPDGYLRRLTVVRFNAWHYAEANLWASLVDQVLRAIGPTGPSGDPPDVADVKRRAADAGTQADTIDKKVKTAGDTLITARNGLATRRRTAWALSAGVLVLAAVAVVAVVIGGSGRFVAGVSAALALLGSAVGALDQARRAGTHAGELADAGRAGLGTLSRLAGRPEELAVRAAAANLQGLVEEQARARGVAERLEEDSKRVQNLAAQEPLGTLLHSLAFITEYRDQLSLVARTRERFHDIDKEVTRSRLNRSDGGVATTGDLGVDRIVIMIDDLDRCPPENVVKVLEAVHLLFDFEMFVVVLAVDTRWLDQSLRIRYRELLGEQSTAAPLDYLEKIIQIPLHLRPLDEGLVRTMIAGLAGDPAKPTDIQVPLHTASGDRAASTPTAHPRQDAALTADRSRARQLKLPAQVLRLSEDEATALSAVSPLIGTTPRTVKRFVNTYQLLKARTRDPTTFDQLEDSFGDHEAVAFLLAVLTGRSAAAATLLTALATAPDDSALQSVIPPRSAGPDRLSDASAPSTGDSDPFTQIRDWLAANPRYAQAPVRRYSPWAREVARFSFTSPEPTQRLS